MISTMPRDARRTHLGSSDMAAIMGFDLFHNVHDIYLEKTNKLIDERKELDVMRRGHYLEPAILNYAEAELGRLERDVYCEAPDYFLGANVDAIVYDSKNPVEAKSQGSFSKEHWGEEGSDEVPDRVIIQSHVHMICACKRICHVPAYLPYREFQMFQVNYDDEIASIIQKLAVQFWTEHVLADIPPSNVPPAMELIKRIRRQPETITNISQELVDAWLAKKQALKLAETEKDTAESAMLVALNQAEAGQTEKGLLTYYEQQRTGIDSGRLKAEKPEIVKAYTKISTFRVARFKETK